MGSDHRARGQAQVYLRGKLEWIIVRVEPNKGNYENYQPPRPIIVSCPFLGWSSCMGILEKQKLPFPWLGPNRCSLQRFRLA
ncbi:hypothetical protein SAY87_002085 [Trapa incisa]|uniref:Uncharacterized protein n=1 Tax=Trapa incisa TaxID=236973 RepID=A0AAN7JTJ1_9MYRT|nr:hypothetical protein SAY87_002085 [Trapa incisa]